MTDRSDVHSAPLELWAGPEPSTVRVQAHCTDQLRETGVADRPDLLDRLAALGVRCVRLPLLWERTERADGQLDFRWADTWTARARALGLRVIGGLLHHGSGPRHTDLLDPGFPAKLAAYAAAVAARYPWIEDWTPVNEPLTTARFSALYGHWYPHRRDDGAFVRALLHQVQGVGAAMRRIRAVHPAARLVQTEDLGRTEGSPSLQAQVDFENERRWLSLDLLCGRVDRTHPLWGYLVGHGLEASALMALSDRPTPPHLVGINHYVTSDRYLDAEWERHAPAVRGGNGRQRYADVEAVRIRGARPGGVAERLREAALRYGRPVAATEVQLGCTREEQLRWFDAAWQGALRLRAEGLDVRAVTAWAAFGAVDWDSLLTQRRGRYEPGLFDARGPVPRPTAVAALARRRALQAAGVAEARAPAGAGARQACERPGGEPAHPVLQGPGWWDRAERVVVAPAGPLEARPVAGRPVLILGRSGTLGQAFARLCRQRGLPYRLVGREAFDLQFPDVSAYAARLAQEAPWAVVNAAGYVRVDDAESDPRQWLANALGPVALARAAARLGLACLSFSSDLVFDGSPGAAGPRRAYDESDVPRPLSAYGRAKHHAEPVLAALPGCLVVRSAAFFGPWDAHNFLTGGLQRLARGEAWPALADQTVSPTHVPDLVHACLDLLVDGETGLWHLTHASAVSWYGLACMAAEAAGLPRQGIRRLQTAEAGQRALRPAWSALASRRGNLLPSLADALQHYEGARRAGVPGPVADRWGLAPPPAGDRGRRGPQREAAEAAEVGSAAGVAADGAAVVGGT